MSTYAQVDMSSKVRNRQSGVRRQLIDAIEAEKASVVVVEVATAVV